MKQPTYSRVRESHQSSSGEQGGSGGHWKEARPWRWVKTLSLWAGKSWRYGAAVGESLDVILLPLKSQTQTGDERGNVLITVPREKRRLIHQQFTD